MRWADLFPPLAGARVFLALFFAAHAALALDITTTDGQTYRKCVIAKVSGDSLDITHDYGAARIPYDKLPAKLRQKYFDPAKVAAYRGQAAEARQTVAARNPEANASRNMAASRDETEPSAPPAEAPSGSVKEKLQAQAERITASVKKMAGNENRDKTSWGIWLAFIVVAGLSLYFLPAIIARGKTNARAIFFLNLFTGWSLLGWIVSFIWAASSPPDPERIS